MYYLTIFTSSICMIGILGKFVGLPPQWLSLVQGGGNSSRPKPIIDPSNITPTEIMDLKSHTIVRGQGSAVNVASAFVAANKESGSSRTLVTRSNSLRRVESPVSHRILNRVAGTVPPNIPENADLVNGNVINQNVNPTHGTKQMAQMTNQEVNHQIPSNLYNSNTTFQQNMNSSISMMHNSFVPRNANPNLYQQVLPNGILNSNGFHSGQPVFSNKARFSMLPQTQQAQMMSHPSVSSANYPFSVASNMNPMHTVMPNGQQPPMNMSPNKYPPIVARQANHGANNSIAEHSLTNGGHINHLKENLNMQLNNNSFNHSKPTSHQINQMSQNFSNLSIKPPLNGVSVNNVVQPNGILNHQVANSQISPLTNSQSAKDFHNNNAPTQLNSNVVLSDTSNSVNYPNSNKNIKNTNFNENTQHSRSANNNVNSTTTSTVAATQANTTSAPAVPAHTQQRVTHEQFRSALQMVVNPGDPRFVLYLTHSTLLLTFPFVLDNFWKILLRSEKVQQVLFVLRTTKTRSVK